MKPLPSTDRRFRLRFVRSLVRSGSAITLAGTISAASPDAIQTAPLNDRVVYTVPVATNRVTTIAFPGAIAAIDAAGFTTDPKQAGHFLMGHAKGSSFFSVRALSANATGNANVRWNGRTYIFEFTEHAAPVLSLILETHPSGGMVHPAPRPSPTALLALLDKSKAFPLLKAQHPDAVADVDFTTFADRSNLTDCGDYALRLEEGFRFNPEDTLVFRVALTNRTESAITYRPGSFALRAGNRLYPQSISDASGVLPPLSETIVHFAVTGTPDGGRNELSLQNDFLVLLERFPASPEAASVEPSRSVEVSTATTTTAEEEQP